MAAQDEKLGKLIAAARTFVSQNDEVNFAAETVAWTALEIAGGDAGRAEALLGSMEEFSRAALLKSSDDRIAASRALLCISRELIDNHVKNRRERPAKPDVKPREYLLDGAGNVG